MGPERKMLKETAVTFDQDAVRKVLVEARSA